MEEESATPYYYHRPGSENSVSRVVAFVLILVFAVVLGWLTTKNSLLPFSGLRGIAAEVSPAHSTIVLSDAKVLDDSRFSPDGINRFIVQWNEDTIFYLYYDKSEMRAGNASPATMDDLSPDQQVVVLPREKAGNVITALEVRILPE